jgi:hypothetical protein
MNMHNVKQKLDKVNRFYSYLDTNQEIVSRVDRDALLASIRQLYDACFDGAPAQEATIEDNKVETALENPITVTEETTVDFTKKKRPKLVFTNNTSTSAKEEVAKANAVPVTKEEITIAPIAKEEVKEVAPKQEPVIKVKEEIKEEEVNKSKNVSSSFNDDYEELFLFKAATDISQKLSEAPLEDLNKALGLNEKFLYINELYGGDVAKFQASMKVLNDGQHFDSARVHMESELIEKFEWMNKLKKSIAKDFVKLVRRRYL